MSDYINPESHPELYEQYSVKKDKPKTEVKTQVKQTQLSTKEDYITPASHPELYEQYSIKKPEQKPKEPSAWDKTKQWFSGGKIPETQEELQEMYKSKNLLGQVYTKGTGVVGPAKMSKEEEKKFHEPLFKFDGPKWHDPKKYIPEDIQKKTQTLWQGFKKGAKKTVEQLTSPSSLQVLGSAALMPQVAQYAMPPMIGYQFGKTGAEAVIEKDFEKGGEAAVLAGMLATPYVGKKVFKGAKKGYGKTKAALETVSKDVKARQGLKTKGYEFYGNKKSGGEVWVKRDPSTGALLDQQYLSKSGILTKLSKLTKDIIRKKEPATKPQSYLLPEQLKGQPQAKVAKQVEMPPMEQVQPKPLPFKQTPQQMVPKQPQLPAAQVPPPVMSTEISSIKQQQEVVPKAKQQEPNIDYLIDYKKRLNSKKIYSGRSKDIKKMMNLASKEGIEVIKNNKGNYVLKDMDTGKPIKSKGFSVTAKQEDAVLLEQLDAETNQNITDVIENLGTDLDVDTLTTQQKKGAIKDIKEDKGKEASIRAQEYMQEVIKGAEEGGVGASLSVGKGFAKQKQFVPFDDFGEIKKQETEPTFDIEQFEKEAAKELETGKQRLLAEQGLDKLQKPLPKQKYIHDEGLFEEPKERDLFEDLFGGEESKMPEPRRPGILSGQGGFIHTDFFKWIVNVEKVSQDVVKVKDSAKKAYAHLYPNETIKDIIKTYDSGMKLAKYESAITQKQLTDLIPDKTVRDQLSFYIESKSVPLELKDIANKIREIEDTNLKAAKDYGVEVGFVEDHIMHVWEKPAEVMMAWKSENLKSLKSLGIKTAAQKKRTIPSLQWGIDRGFVPKTTDVAELVSINENSLKQAITRKKTIDLMLDMGAIVEAKDAPVGYVEITDPGIKQLLPKGKKLITTQQGYLFQMPGEVKSKPVKIDYAIDPDMLKVLDRLMNKSLLKDVPVVKQLLVAQAFGKRSLFELNPFFHGLALIKSAMFKPTDMALKKGVRLYKSGDAIVKEAMSAGLELGAPIGSSRQEVGGVIQAFSERIPVIEGVGYLQRGIDWLLWDQVHTGLKINTYVSARDALYKKYPKYSKDVLNEWAATFSNDIYGGLNWDRMLTSKTIQDLSRLALIAPDWTLSNLRSGSGLISGYFSPATEVNRAYGHSENKKAGFRKRVKYGWQKSYPYRRYWRNVLGALVTITQLINLTRTKQDFGEARFTWENEPDHKWHAYLYTDGEGKKVYADLLGFLTDNIEMVISPGTFFYRKAAHVPKMIYDQFRNKDWKDHPITYKHDPLYKNLMKRMNYAIKTFVPITISQLLNSPKQLKRKIVSSMGVPLKQEYPREAQEYMIDLGYFKRDITKQIYKMIDEWDESGSKDSTEAQNKAKTMYLSYNEIANKVLTKLSEEYRFIYDIENEPDKWSQWFITPEKIVDGWEKHKKNKSVEDLYRILRIKEKYQE